LADKALPLFVTLPTHFLITFLLTRQVKIEFYKDLELRGDKFRDLKKRKDYFELQKAELYLIFHPSKLIHSVQNKFCL